MKSITIEHLEKYQKEFNAHQYYKVIDSRSEKGECDARDNDRFYMTLLEATLKAIPSFSKRKWDIEKEYQKIKNNENATAELFRNYTVMEMIRFWLDYKQIYKFDKDALETLLSTDCNNLTCEEIRALKMPYDCFAIENEIVYGDVILDSMLVHRACVKDNNDMILSIYGFAKNDGKETKMVRLDNIIDNDKTLFDFLESDANEDAKKFIKKIMNLILYLCQPKVDVIYKKSEKGKSLSNPNKQKELPKSFYAVAYDTNEVGCRLGNAIRNYRVQYEKSDKNNPGSAKRVVKPHNRRGHFHHYWVGKGRTDLIVKYVNPTFVLGGSKKATLHKVKSK